MDTVSISSKHPGSLFYYYIRSDEGGFKFIGIGLGLATWIIVAVDQGSTRKIDSVYLPITLTAWIINLFPIFFHSTSLANACSEGCKLGVQLVCSAISTMAHTAAFYSILSNPYQEWVVATAMLLAMMVAFQNCFVGLHTVKRLVDLLTGGS